jgi:protein-S-isoprenylcysteine O-methyltransferase Ste14
MAAGAVGPWFAASYYILSILLGAALSTGAMLLEENAFQDKPDAGRTLWLFVYSIVENFGYRQMTRACRIGWGRSRSKG